MFPRYFLPFLLLLSYISKRVAYSGHLLAITNNGIDSPDDLRLYSIGTVILAVPLPIFVLAATDTSIDNFLYFRVLWFSVNR